MASLTTYNGYKLTERDDTPQRVAVFDPRFPLDPALYRTDSLDAARAWVDAYRDGRQWAVAAVLR